MKYLFLFLFLLVSCSEEKSEWHCSNLNTYKIVIDDKREYIIKAYDIKWNWLGNAISIEDRCTKQFYILSVAYQSIDVILIEDASKKINN